MDRPLTLTAVTSQNIREAILRGDFRPGDSLGEVELSKSREVSRGTVREALRLLREEGLVQIIPHRGAFVANLSVKNVREIYTLRALLEPYAIRLAMEANAYSEECLQQLEALVQKLGESDLGGDYSQSIETDMAFHTFASQRCNHELLLSVLSSLQSRTLIFILNTKLYRSDMVSDSVSHRAILDGIRGGDPQAAEEIVRKHITDAGSSLVKRMEEFNRGEDNPALQGEYTPLSKSA